MSHHCSPQRLHLLRFFFFAFTSTFSKNSQGSKSGCMSRRFFARVNTRSTSRAEHPAGSPGSPGIPVQSLSFPESAPIPAGIPDPCVPVTSQLICTTQPGRRVPDADDVAVAGGLLEVWVFTSEVPVMFLVGFDPVTSSIMNR